MKIKNVDIAINVYGKPYQTALTIHSLLKYSGNHIGKIFLILERNQPKGFDKKILLTLLEGLDIKMYTPKIYNGYWGPKFNKKLFFLKIFRYSIRYQYAWENTKADYLFITHNDMVYNKDIISGYLNEIEGHIAIGSVGQCWNCPAHKINCDGTKYWEYRPDKIELRKLYEEYNYKIREVNPIEKFENSWPLPECRLNEMAAMFNMQIARPITIPQGKYAPIGLMSLDIGTEWFKDISLAGYKVVNHAFSDYAQHAMFNKFSSGHGSLFNKELYNYEEDMAKEIMELADEMAASAAAFNNQQSYSTFIQSREQLKKLLDDIFNNK